MPLGGLVKDPVQGFRANRGWRTAVLARAEGVLAELVLASEQGRFVLDLSQAGDARVQPGRVAAVADVALARRVLECVDDARYHAGQRSYPWRWLSGSHNEGAWARLHAADLYLVELMSPGRLAAFAPAATYVCRRELAPSDPRRRGVERIARLVAKPRGRLRDSDRGVIRDGLEAAYGRNAQRYQRVRSLRNMTVAMASFLFVLLVSAILVGRLNPGALSMCLEADTAQEQGAFVCPVNDTRASDWDVALVALAGMTAAGISAARALTGVTKRLGPYSPVVAQGALKIVMGGLFAVFGVMLLRAHWVPGVDDVDTGAEILAWALLFGYGQQVLTGMLDQRAEKALTPEQPPGGGPAATAPAGDEIVPDDDGGDAAPAEGDGADGTAADGTAADGTAADGTTVEDAVDDAVDDAADVAPGGSNLVPDVPPGDDAAAGEPVDEADAAVDEGDADAPEGDAPPEPAPPPRTPRKRAPSTASGGSSRPSGRRRGSA